MFCSVFFSLFNNWDFFKILFSVEDFPPFIKQNLGSGYIRAWTFWNKLQTDFFPSSLPN